MNSPCKYSHSSALVGFSCLFMLLALGRASVWADVLPPPVEYAARVSSISPYNWDSGFWWIPSGGTPFSLATLTGAYSPPERIGSYSHPVSSLAVGEGYGIQLQSSGPSSGVYLVQAYTCATDVSTDVLVRLVSTNAVIDVYPGMGTVTACTALQARNCQNQWGPVCYLTNNPGAPRPALEFHYVSGANGNLYADCVSFTALYQRVDPRPCWIENGQLYISFNNPGLSQVVLLQSFDASTPLNAWLPLATNTSYSGIFTTPVLPVPAAFYRFKFQ